MRFIYFLRHGQAGTRVEYDRLSPLGTEQARLLGRYLAADGVRLTAFYSGELQRQRETAACVAESFPGMRVQTDARWNEFDLDAVYRGIAPQLASDDETFRQHWADLEAAVAGGDHAIHRRWTKADTAVVRAWVENRYQFDGESWTEFSSRIASALDSLCVEDAGDAIAVSTSATPAAICIGLGLELSPRQVMRLAGSSFNAAYSVLRSRGRDLSLVTFNAIPHLVEHRLRTYR